MQVIEHQPQIYRIADCVHRYTHDLSVNTQLLVRAYPVAVGGQQRQLFRAKTRYTTGRQIGCCGGLADPGRSHQCINAAAVHHGIFIFKYRHGTRQFRFDPCHPGCVVMTGRQLVQHAFRQLPTETRA